MDNKLVLHDLLVTINDYVLNEKTRPTILDIVERMDYYTSIVSEYYYLNDTLMTLKNTLTDGELMSIVERNIELLELSFTSYKNEMIVTDIIMVHDSNDERIEFFDKLVKFEKSLISNPIIKVDEESIQDIINTATIFAKKVTKIYYFQNNPFEVDETYKVVIPTKKIYTVNEIFLSDLYTYLFGIFTTYKYKNNDELRAMNAIETELTHRLNEFQNYVIGLNTNKIEISGNRSTFYNNILALVEQIETYKQGLMGMHIYRYYSLNSSFNLLVAKINVLLKYYKTSDLFVEELENLEFTNKLVELEDNIKLLEKGVVLVDKDYLVDTDATFQSLVTEIIESAQHLKRDIIYTEQYSDTGSKEELTFTYYQTTDFFNSIKSYYHKLMTIEGFDFNTIKIEDFGDNTTIALRNMFTVNHNKYKNFISQSTEYMTQYEIREFIKEVEAMQSILRLDAVSFFANAFETSPVTFAQTIEIEYKNFTNSLITDLAKFTKLSALILDSNVIREEALTILNKSITYYDSLIILLQKDIKHSMLNNTKFITANLLGFFKDYKEEIVNAFNREDYSGVIVLQENFYKNSTLNHNMFIALTVLTDNVETIFDHYINAQNIFVTEQLQSKPIDKNNEDIKYIQYLFEDNMIEAIRQELSSNLDNFYLYMIDKNQNLKQFLLNEKNLKISYFDNSSIKANYIRLYNKILSVTETYAVELKAISLKNEYAPSHIINTFNYSKQLETLIMYQNDALASLAKIITEQYIDDNYDTDTIQETAIDSIAMFNSTIDPDILLFESELLKYREIQTNKKLISKHDKIKEEHSDSWFGIVNKNTINPIKPISYNELETIKGTVPFMIEMSADFDLVADELPTFTWEINGDIITGKDISYTLYKEGITKVICSRTYPSGETTVRYVEFDIAGPTNSQVVKSNTIEYSPTADYVNQPVITMIDPKTNTKITVPINVNGDLAAMITDGKIIVSESDSDLLVEKAGLVLVGFEGIEIAGTPFDYKQIFAEDFEMPKEADFLFDFQVSDPVAHKSVIDITKSSFVTAMAKVPSSKVSSVYDISDVRDYQMHNGKTLPVIVGDIIIMKNKTNKYALIEINSISSATDIEAGKYNFEIVFDIHVNISLNKFEQTNFRPMATNYVVPTLIFETNSKELFSSLIERIEKINSLQLAMEKTIDTEKKIIYAEEIKEIKYVNNKFYLFSEYNKLSAKILMLEDKLEVLNTSIDYNTIDTTSIIEANKVFSTQLNETHTFSEYMNDTKLYDFRNNIVDLSIIIELYQEQQKMLEIILGTFDYMNRTPEHFLKMFESCKHIDKALIDKKQYENLSYLKQLPLIVQNARTHLYRLKLVINLPILIAGKYIIPSTSFDRVVIDTNGEHSTIDDMDFYLLNKKIELAFGYENKKEKIIDCGLIAHITELVKEHQGIGLSEIDRTTISTYIEEVERRAVIEYDDFFMLPFWMDYLTKLL